MAHTITADDTELCCETQSKYGDECLCGCHEDG